MQDKVSIIVRNMAVNEIIRIANKKDGLEQKKLLSTATEVLNGRYSFNYLPCTYSDGVGRNLDISPLVAVVIDNSCPNHENVFNTFNGVLPIEYIE